MKRKELLPTILAIVSLAVIWQIIATQIGFPAIFPSLFVLVKQVFLLFVSEHFFTAVLTTILRGISGFFLAFAMAFLMATIARFSDFWKSFFHPVIVVARSIPVISFVLIAILWFSPPYLPVFIALITMFPILYQTILTGLEQADHKWIEMAKVFGKSPYQQFISIYLPASKSVVYDGVSTAMGFGWRAVIIGEVLAQPLHGIGTSMKQAQAFINVSELIAWTVIAVGVSYLFEGIIKLLRKIHCEEKLSKATSKIIPSFQTSEIKRIKIENVDKRFNSLLIINSFTSAFDNTVVSCLKGPSGVGKTTILRLLAQLEKPDSGHVISPKSFQMGYSFQDVRLLPWLTNAENIAYVLHSKHIHKQEISNQVTFLLEKMELAEHGHKYPDELSGGQQQRVGLARALASKPDILLLDEPLTGLDDALKIRISNFLSEWITANKPIVVWATHEDVKLPEVKVREVVL